jgi:PPOX class probable F420-dependent enzyme
MTLSPAERHLLAAARRATLATIGPDGRARLVPICFVVDDDVLWTPLDDKPKAVADVHDLARVRDVVARPDVTVLVDRWAEDWSELAWLRLHGRASLEAAGDVPRVVIDALRAKHPQYRDHDLEHRPCIRIDIDTVTAWWASAD